MRARSVPRAAHPRQVPAADHPDQGASGRPYHPGHFEGPRPQL